MPQGPITRARAKKFKEALFGLIKLTCLEGFEEGSVDGGMCKETSQIIYLCMTIVSHED